MTSSDDDEDLGLAIALSLQDQPPTSRSSGLGKTAQDAINLDSDDEIPLPTASNDRRPRKQMEGYAPSDNSNQVSDSSITVNEPESASMSASSLGILGLDRRKMEEERIARKRKLSISPPPARKSLKTSACNSVESTTLSRQPPVTGKLEKLTNDHTTSTAKGQPPRSTSSGSVINSQAKPNSKGPVFLHGTVKKTWAFGHPRQDDIKLEEVLQRDDLALAVLSSFQWEIDWLFSKLNTRSTQITLVMQAKDEATKQQYRHETSDMPNLRLCFPSMEGQVNCMHSKLMLLSHPSYLRIVVPTANLVNYDWGESGVMENMVFLIDLPRLPAGRRTELEGLTSFGQELIYFLEAMGLERSIINSIYSFDFQETKDLAFVHAIGGAHTGNDEPWRRTGYCGLGRAVKNLGLATDRALSVDFVTSSVGSLNIEFLTILYLAAQGDAGMTEYVWRNPGTGRGKAATSSIQDAKVDQEELKVDIEQNFHIYFPTHETVRASTARSAGTICFQSKWYNSPTFPRQAMRDCKSVRAGVLMHNKVRLEPLWQSVAYADILPCRFCLSGANNPIRPHRQAPQTPSPGLILDRRIALRARGAS